MTDREKAIVTAYTGINMLEGERFNVFYKYLEELYGRPVYTHEIPFLDMKEKSEDDFLKLCRDEPTIEPQKWIPVSERMPEEGTEVLGTDDHGCIRHVVKDKCNLYEFATYEEMMHINIVAWMPLPEPYKEGGENAKLD